MLVLQTEIYAHLCIHAYTKRVGGVKTWAPERNVKSKGMQGRKQTLKPFSRTSSNMFELDS